MPPSNIPIPDPSVITEREIAKAKTELREESKLALAGLRDTFSATRDGYYANVNNKLESLAENLDKETQRLERLGLEKTALIQAKFDGVNQRLIDRDSRFEAVFQAQKDAALRQNENVSNSMAKIEASFTKEIDSLKTLLNATKDAITADVANLKGRIDRGEGGFAGARTVTEDVRANTTLNITIISGVVGFFVLLVMIAGLWMSTHAATRSQPEVVFSAPAAPSVSRQQGSTQ